MSKLLTYSLLGLGLAFVIYTMAGTIHRQRAEIGSLSRSITALSDTGKLYKDKLGNTVTQKKALELTVGDLRKVNSELYNRVSALSLSLKRAESAVLSHSVLDISKTVRTDTIAGHITATYEDVHAYLHSEVRPDSTIITVRMRDTIVGVISIEPKRFLFIKWGVKSVQSDISNTNPYIRITTDIAVKFKK
ncbi:hypothetical protein PM93P1_00031 [Parabacteroides phage PM93P1]|nr:hypothetical protein PM93P1_00031 [Parabacteroides phage PM93P1]